MQGNQPEDNIFALRDFHRHGQVPPVHRALITTDPLSFQRYLRRLLAANFTEKWISNLEPFIAKNTKLAVSRMADEVAKRGYADVFKWFMFMASIRRSSQCLVSSDLVRRPM
jgi:cytochrome P450